MLSLALPVAGSDPAFRQPRLSLLPTSAAGRACFVRDAGGHDGAIWFRRMFLGF